MEVSPKRSNVLPEGPIVSSVGLHRMSYGGLIFPMLSELFHERLSVSLGGIKLR